MFPLFRVLAFVSAVGPLVAVSLSAQAIQVKDAARPSDENKLHLGGPLPSPALGSLRTGDVVLLPGLFHERRELTKGYLLRLKTEDLLQNHLLEAGVRTEKAVEQMHLGWESPQCQLRGHFVGHWLSAAARWSAIDHDPLLAARASEVVAGLQHCQELNHGQWVGSIPEKYFTILSEGREPIWSPQYTLHKTMMGLFDAYVYTGNQEALRVTENSAAWFLHWSDSLVQSGRGEAVYGGECAGMLELWANLYGATGDARYLALAAHYAMPDLFRRLLEGGDPLTNNHANASIPWIQGAARLYEVTGDTRYRDIVFNFWRKAVEERGMFATTGANAGEYWIPPGQFGRFLGNRTQEHCTVYNMIRVAEILLRWTGDSRYADYIERALYNGILAQQNPNTGLVSYFLPLQPGAKKSWGTETHDFWCCHGTLLQAQAMYESLVCYRTADGLTISQFIPSRLSFSLDGNSTVVTQATDTAREVSDFSAPDPNLTHFNVLLTVSSTKAASWTLRIRQPSWAVEPGRVSIDGVPVSVAVSKNGFLEITREWQNARVQVSFAKKITREYLPGDQRRFALLDGPVVLAAVTDREPGVGADLSLTPYYEHQYVEGREWMSGHYWLQTRQGTVVVKPLYEIADENYCVYFADTP